MSIKKKLLTVAVLAASTGLGLGPSLAAEGDPARGENVFKRCVSCHSLEPGKKRPTGPNLYGVFGRVAAADPDYRYTPAMKEAGASGLVWNDENLMAYLEDPRKFVPKSRMILKLPKEQDRLDVIEHLKLFGDNADAAAESGAEAEAPATP